MFDSHVLHKRQELSNKEQAKVVEVNKVRVELQEQLGHLEAERTAQEGMREKIAALERQLKGKGRQSSVSSEEAADRASRPTVQWQEDLEANH